MSLDGSPGRYALAIAAVAVLGLAFLLVQSAPHAAATDGGSPDCEFSPVHNTALLRATPVATVEAGARLNGTAGTVWFTDLPSYPPGFAHSDPVEIKWWRLEGPGNATAGPMNAIRDDVIFHDVPLCETGTWRLVAHETNDTYSRFQTTLESDPHPPDAIQLDYPADTDEEASYYAGRAGNGGAVYEGKLDIGRPAGELLRTNVTVDWRSDLSNVSTTSYMIATVWASGEEGAYLTSKRLPDGENGTISTYPAWRAPSMEEVHIVTWSFSSKHSFHLRGYSGTAAPVTIWPETVWDPLESAMTSNGAQEG